MKTERSGGKFDGYVLISDFDGTFFTGNKAGLQKNIDAVAYFKQEGGRFAFATGRTLMMFEALLPNFTEIINAPCIMGNGTFLYDFEAEKILEKRPLDMEYFVPLLAHVIEKYPKLGVRMCTHDRFYTTAINEGIVIDIDEEVYSTPVLSLDQVASQRDILKCVYCFEDGRANFDESKMAELRAFVLEHDHSAFTYTQSCPFLLEMATKGVSKGTMIPALRVFYQNEKIKVIAVGDYENDIEMLQAVDLSAAPANALPEVKATATLSLVHCDGGAVADLIEQLGCIGQF